MSIADKYRPQFTYTDYCQWEGRWELIDGMPYAMSPAPAISHQRINGMLYTKFNTSLTKACPNCEVFMPVDWKIDEKTVVQPDLLIICKKTDKVFLDFAPLLTVEILSPSTAYKDRHEKYELYEEQGVKYYVIADPVFKKIEIYELIEQKYQPVSVNPSVFEFRLNGECNVQVDFEGTWL
ncbi:MAG: Uma2 family endonuclease [Chitinophagaceae bacterium]